MAITPVIIYPFRHTQVTFTPDLQRLPLYMEGPPSPGRSVQAAAILAIYTKNINGD
jgi:hypothetical protein